VVEIHIRLGEAGVLGTPQAGKQWKIHVITGSYASKLKCFFMPEFELIVLNDGVAALNLVPCPYLTQTVHRVYRQ